MRWLLICILTVAATIPPRIIAPNLIKVNWTASTAATGYRLYVGNTSGHYLNIYQAAGTNLILTLPFPISFFAVTATNQVGESAYSAEWQYPKPNPQTNIVTVSVSVEQTSNFLGWSTAWTYPDVTLTNPPDAMFYRTKLGIRSE